MKIDEKEFENIYQTTYNKILRHVIIKCNNMDDVNDIIQDTYVEFYKILRRGKFTEADNIERYIYGVANNIIKRHYSKKKKENIVSYYDESISNQDIKDDIDIEQNIITKENVKQVWEYLQCKDLITVKSFYLYYVLDLQLSEIAKELNINESTIKNKIYRTLKELKKQYVQECILEKMKREIRLHHLY